MTKDLIPPDRIEFYNMFVSQAVLSATEAIDDSVEKLTGNRCDKELRQEIASILSGACKDYAARLDTRAGGIGRGEWDTHLITAPNDWAARPLQRALCRLHTIGIRWLGRFPLAGTPCC